MSLFTDDKTKEVQFNLFQEALDALFVGIIVVNDKHQIVYANKVIAAKVHYEQGWLIGREIHELLPPDFRERHREILTGFFANPYHVAIEQREGNVAEMKMVPRGEEKDSAKWLPVRIGIHPLFVDPTQEVFQTGDVTPRLKFGLAEISFTGTFN
jgi:PAS domain S-box-containing protein